MDWGTIVCAYAVSEGSARKALGIGSGEGTQRSIPSFSYVWSGAKSCLGLSYLGFTGIICEGVKTLCLARFSADC